MKQKLFSLLMLSIVITSLYSCGGRSKNQKIVEAQKIHATMLTRYDSIYSTLQDQEKRVEKKLNALSPNNPDRAAYLSMQRSIHKSYDLLQNWKQGITDVPGFSQDGAKKTQTPGGINPDKMSDQEILDLQKAYDEKLDQIGRKVRELMTTMDMYTK